MGGHCVPLRACRARRHRDSGGPLMILGIRGIMDKDGSIHTWPTVAMTHSKFFATMPWLREGLRARFRQWHDEAGADIDFDPGVTDEDRRKGERYVRFVQTGRVGIIVDGDA